MLLSSDCNIGALTALDLSETHKVPMSGLAYKKIACKQESVSTYVRVRESLFKLFCLWLDALGGCFKCLLYHMLRCFSEFAEFT